ncbi:MAG: serine hydrolase domain-containing protein [Acidimicrobiales bacterium]
MLQVIDDWPVATVAAAVVGPEGVREARGPLDEVLAWASLTKLLSALAVHVACEEGTLRLDQPAGPPGSTIAHLLAHASGLGPGDGKALAGPGERRIYSNAGFELLADELATASGMPFGAYVDEAVLGPLGMASTRLEGSAAAGASGSTSDLVRFAVELQGPTVTAPATLARASAVAFPGLDGVLPGYGSQRPNDWGLGFEVRGTKAPHWTAPEGSPRTFGHFGRAGGFCWVDPDAGVACVSLADRDFGPWSQAAWPPLASAVLAAHGRE